MSTNPARSTRLLLLLVYSVALSASCKLCENELLAQAVSPDGRRKAVTFVRSCGATTGESIQISIVAHDGKEDGGGNTFVADGNRIAGLDLGVRAEWTGPERLTIRFNGPVFSERSR